MNKIVKNIDYSNFLDGVFGDRQSNWLSVVLAL